MQKIRLNNHIYTGPGSWAELDAVGLLMITFITGRHRFKNFIPHFLVIKLFKLPAKTFWRLKECQKIQVEKCLDWMNEKNAITRWLIKKVNIRARNYYGPKDKLADLTVEEFMFAEAAYVKWQNDHEHTHLNTLFAALYRRHAFFGTARLAFTEARKASGEKIAYKLAPHFKEAIALNYSGCRNNIIARHPHVWRDEKTNPHEKLLTPQILQLVNWPGLALELSGDKFGTYNQTIKMNLWVFLADMDKKAKRAMELEAKK